MHSPFHVECKKILEMLVIKCGEVLYCRQWRYGSWHCAPTKPQSRYAQNQIEKRGPDTFTGLSGPIKEAGTVSRRMVLKIRVPASSFACLLLQFTDSATAQVTRGIN
jgi:hypothetical protein